MPQLDFLEKKIHSLPDLLKELQRLRLKGKTIAFTNGVFDILHKGHVTLLAKASEYADFLILGLNSDKSVKTLGKGPDRPINSELDRAFVLAGLSSVYAIVIFEESTPRSLIKLIEPDVLIKGGDYNPDQIDDSAKDYIVGSDIQRKNGKLTVSIDLVNGYSTTSTIKKIADG